MRFKKREVKFWLAEKCSQLKESKGENPIKANGKMIVIDGGFSKACQSTTGIAGYTLLYNSYGMQFVAYKHFDSKAEVLSIETDVLLTMKRLVDKKQERKKLRERMWVRNC
ncbi:Fructose-1,6-bisphosphatase class 3 [Bacillus velezensis]|nr:hypothetical protein AW26_0117170 [Bacillus amyloliquefaciens EBL11]QHK07169.1 Fructose-1,6-bisphosphatase class 3 [Bacillus velezensis]QHK12692.1 Fructose-1,6-bisphosphatase class 3 [Bacillus velezensis]QHK13540.1 Fructose-1,6-bisphosphatase class 3 [Bacillus velezensis]QHK63443.1 Fructose-1,6-bisphosphatase class 3 [Bacillus velezensis]